MVACSVTSQNNLKTLLDLTGSAEMKNVSKFPTAPVKQKLLRVTLQLHVKSIINKTIGQPSSSRQCQYGFNYQTQ